MSGRSRPPLPYIRTLMRGREVVTRLAHNQEIAGAIPAHRYQTIWGRPRNSDLNHKQLNNWWFTGKKIKTGIIAGLLRGQYPLIPLIYIPIDKWLYHRTFTAASLGSNPAGNTKQYDTGYVVTTAQKLIDICPIDYQRGLVYAQDE